MFLYDIHNYKVSLDFNIIVTKTSRYQLEQYKNIPKILFILASQKR